MRAGEPERLRSVLLAVGRDVTAPDAGRSRLTEAILMRKIPGARSPGSLAVCRELLYAEGHGRTMAEEVPGLVYAAESGDLDIVADVAGQRRGCGACAGQRCQRTSRGGVGRSG
jgi:hypothetical protein